MAAWVVGVIHRDADPRENMDHAGIAVAIPPARNVGRDDCRELSRPRLLALRTVQEKGGHVVRYIMAKRLYFLDYYGFRSNQGPRHIPR